MGDHLTFTHILNTTGCVQYDEGSPIRVQFRFADSDPFAITLVFYIEDGEEIAWDIGRELLSSAVNQLQGEYGEGDVAIQSSVVMLDIKLQTAEDLCFAVTFDKQELGQFVQDIDSRLTLNDASTITLQQLDEEITNLFG